MTHPAHHGWLRDPAPVDLGPRLATVSAHRRLRGPYTAAGAVVRLLVPGLLAGRPDLVRAHDLEILAAAPELAAVVDSHRETLTSTADPKSRTRYYPHAHTTRIAHGLTDLLRDATAGTPGLTLVIEHVEHADRTDLDWLGIMLRRIAPERLRIVLSCRGELPEPLAAAVAAHAVRLTDAPGPEVEVQLPADPDAVRDLADRYVSGDCVDDDPLTLAAYRALPEVERARLHDARAAELDARDEVSLRLGALIHHRLHGTDPEAGLDALDFALEHLAMRGFYDALLEQGALLCGLADWEHHHDRRWLATTKMATALSVMARADEALALYDAACAASAAPSVQMQAAYGRAMLYTRYFEPGRRDLTLARAWINNAITIASGAPDHRRRAYNLTFNENGLALIAMHLGDPAEALRLVEAGLDRLAAELSPAERGQHPSVLQYNRAQLISRMGRHEQAVADYTDVIAADPNHSDYYFERAALLRRLGRAAEALADYDTLIALALPYPESHYNRGDLRAELGDLAGALADFDRVLDLDPEFVDAYVNRAALRYETGDPRGAAADVDAGLALAPDQPQLLCQRALLASDDGRVDAALADLLAAVATEPALTGAWVNLGILCFERGEPAEAVRYFDRALELEDDPEVRENRELASATLAGARG
ncbi:hypothetical protein Lfu02_56930 [Longispora fulva]|uniref:Tetratricopeptide (TPR) repeat protein n=1 Tax=Longispora fulva TaxID=619741 RepID=A0A8J7GRA7_9ACTN|nr:tetratricopeptide repeat protein [Longispora fulva]MBG6137324.1 tetratricopeptide (TPR) repeat protein [Longispora fulva]GIG61321.1 hypothetical protein Lfu02_56930 [Longispora fulva]